MCGFFHQQPQNSRKAGWMPAKEAILGLVVEKDAYRLPLFNCRSNIIAPTAFATTYPKTPLFYERRFWVEVSTFVYGELRQPTQIQQNKLDVAVAVFSKLYLAGV